MTAENKFLIKTKMNSIQFAVLGQLYHTPTKGDFEYLSQALVKIDTNGVINSVITPEDPNFDAQVKKFEETQKLTRLENGQFLMPGMVDLHVHASQWPQAGKLNNKKAIFFM